MLNLTYSIDSEDARAMPADPDASKCYDLIFQKYYYVDSCTIVSIGQKIPISAEFSESKLSQEETASASRPYSRGREISHSNVQQDPKQERVLNQIRQR